MRLTAQQLSEFRSIEKRLSDYPNLCTMPEPPSHQTVKAHEEELSSYKVKMENMFSDTDCKNEKFDIIKELLKVGNLLLSSSNNRPLNALNDYSRHTEMALKVAPRCPAFITRNENHPE